MADTALRVAAGLLLFLGLGFGLPCIYGIWSVATGRGVAIFLGFPTYGGGPFERLGLRTTVPLLAGFLLVCALQVLAAARLWAGARDGALLALATALPALAYYVGFALPVGPLLIVPAIALVLWRWRALP